VAKNPRIKDIKDDARTGEYDEKSHMAAFMDPQVYDNLVEAIEMYARDKKTIIFCNSIAETEGVTGMLKSRGHDAVYVTSEISPNNRKEALERFHEGDVKIMVNCGILTTGYDHPEIEVVVMYRATKSLPLWLQCCGRGSRVVPGVKEHFTIIDLGENARRLGHWEKNRDWTSIWLTDGRSMKDGVPPTKECPECQTDVHISVMTCPSCGYVFESKDDGKPKPKGTLEIVKSELLSRDEVEYILAPLRGKKVLDLSPRELYQFWTAKGHNEFFGARAAAKKGLAYLLEYAKVAGYTAKWASKMHHLYHDKPFNNYTV
jgi:rubredoxin